MSENRTVCWNGLTQTRYCDDEEANARHTLADAARDGEWRRDRIVVQKRLIIKLLLEIWRRGWDSNPRYP